MAVLVLIGCGERPTPPESEPDAVQLPAAVRVLTPSSARALLLAEPQRVILDARHWDEMKDHAYLTGAIPCPYLQGNEEQLAKLERSVGYFVYCPLGERSARTAARMVELGFTDVAVLRGGLLAWSQEGLPLRVR